MLKTLLKSDENNLFVYVVGFSLAIAQNVYFYGYKNGSSPRRTDVYSAGNNRFLILKHRVIRNILNISLETPRYIYKLFENSPVVGE